MTYKIRKGERHDMDSILNLVTELAIFEKEPNAVKITVEDLILNGFKDDPEFYTYVAQVGDEIVGMALYYNRFSTWVGTAIHLEDLIVTKKFRGFGIGRALYNSVLEEALIKGAKRVAWEVLDWNIAAIDFYESTGAVMFKEWNICQISNDSIVNYLSKK